MSKETQANQESELPAVFISYSHDSDEHKEWVRNLATRLMEDFGIEVILDEWEIGGGDNANLFMNDSLKRAVRVVMVCTEEYVRKADAGLAGAGYEANVMNAEVVKDQGGRRFIPVIRQSGENRAMPTFMAGRIYFNFSDDAEFEKSLEKLAREIHDARPLKKPRVGSNPFLGEPEQDTESSARIESGSVSDPLDIYKKALALANDGDFTGWQDLVHSQKLVAEAALLEWKKENQSRIPRERSALSDYFRPAVEIYAGLFAAAVAGIDSEDSRFHNQLNLIDWLRKPRGWERSGPSIWVDLPDLILFTYQAILGAAAMSRHRPELAYRLATTPLEDPETSRDSKALFKSKWAMGWPASLERHCTDAWRFLTSLPGAWSWLTQVLRSEEEAVASIGAYYLFLNSIDFVSAVKSAKENGDDLRGPIVPLGVAVLPREVKARAKSIIGESAEFLAELFVENGIGNEELDGWWERWIHVCLKWIGEIYRDPYFLNRMELPHSTLPRMIGGGRPAYKLIEQPEIGIITPQNYAIQSMDHEQRHDQYGACYWRCALQVNPFAYCEDNAKDTDGLDENAYTSALVQACVDEGIEVIGVTDHHRIESSERLIQEAEAAGLVVFPGFEYYSKDGVHYLCLFDPGTSIKSVQAKLHDCVDHDGESPETVGKYDALEFMEKCHEWKGAICVAAHLCSKNGLLKELSSAPRANAWKSERLLAGCLPGDIDGAPQEHRNILKNKEPEYLRNRPVAIINANDLSSPKDAGKPNVSCWIKMSDVTVEGLRQAFLDPESRVRMECPEEERTEIVSVSWEGGFLDGLTIDFNENLNVLVGGPGSGKSSVVESIRYALGLEPATDGVKTSTGSLIQKVVGRGTKISLRVRVRRPADREYLIERNVPNPPQVREIEDGEAGDLLDVLPKEILPMFDVYGQHEISELARDPTMLTKLLGRFIKSTMGDDGNISELERDLGANRKKLLEVHEELDEVRSKVGQLPALKQKMKHFKKAKVDEKMGLSQALVEEEQVLSKISAEIEAWEEWADDILVNVEEELPDSLSDEAIKELPNLELIKKGRAALKKIPDAGKNAHKVLADAITEAKTEYEKVEKAWEKIKSGNEKAFQKVSRELEKDGIDVDEYLSVLKKIGETGPLEKTARSAKKKEDAHRKTRRELLAELEDARASGFRALEKAAKKVNKRLKSIIRVTAKYSADRQPLFDLIKSEIPKQTAQAIKALSDLEDLTPTEFADACRSGAQELQERYGITSGTAQRIADAGEKFCLFVEELEFPSQTKIELNIARGGETEDWRSLNDLSTGQKATAILLLLLLESEEPLIIDQPEDDLDNRFITRDIVAKMRDGKSRRQFIFATHNANIPVLGDAELIVGMAAEGEGGDLHAVIETDHLGSIDKPSVCQLIKEVLEGGDTAFLKRQEKYGF